MPRLHVEDDEDQEFAESILFSIAAADEFTTFRGQYARSWCDIVLGCLRRGGNFGDGYLPAASIGLDIKAT
jgi:hypothetical protein